MTEHQTADLYRIEERDGGYEAQMLYNAGAVPGIIRDKRQIGMQL